MAQGVSAEGAALVDGLLGGERMVGSGRMVRLLGCSQRTLKRVCEREGVTREVAGAAGFSPVAGGMIVRTGCAGGMVDLVGVAQVWDGFEGVA